MYNEYSTDIITKKIKIYVAIVKYFAYGNLAYV